MAVPPMGTYGGPAGFATIPYASPDAGSRLEVDEFRCVVNNDDAADVHDILMGGDGPGSADAASRDYWANKTFKLNAVRFLRVHAHACAAAAAAAAAGLFAAPKQLSAKWRDRSPIVFSSLRASCCVCSSPPPPLPSGSTGHVGRPDGIFARCSSYHARGAVWWGCLRSLRAGLPRGASCDHAPTCDGVPGHTLAAGYDGARAGKDWEGRGRGGGEVQK